MSIFENERIKELQDKLSRMASVHLELQVAHKKALGEIKKEIQEKNKGIERLSSANVELHGKIKAFLKENDRLVDIIFRTKRENDQLKIDLCNSLTAEYTISKLNKAPDKQVEIRLNPLCEVIVTELNKEIDILKDHNSILREENDRASVSNAIVSNRNEQLSKENDKLKIDLEHYGDRINAYLKENKKIADENRYIRVKFEHSHAREVELNSENERLYQENKTLGEANDRLKADLHANYYNLSLSAEDTRLTEIREAYRSYLDTQTNFYENGRAQTKLIELLNNLVK